MSNFLITEQSEKVLLNYLLSESFIPKSELVLHVLSFVKGSFKPQLLDDVDSNGMPRKVWAVAMMSGNQPVKTMSLADFLLLLDDKFQDFIKNKEDRKRFLKQFITDWINKKITKQGLLSKNYV